MTTSSHQIQTAAQQTDSYIYAKVVFVIILLFLLFLGLRQIAMFFINLCKRKKTDRRKRQVLSHMSQRTVGVQSQTTHNGLRFLAETQGFRRAGEVSVEMIYLHQD